VQNGRENIYVLLGQTYFIEAYLKYIIGIEIQYKTCLVKFLPFNQSEKRHKQQTSVKYVVVIFVIAFSEHLF
jgi:hypothetical protein